MVTDKYVILSLMTYCTRYHPLRNKLCFQNPAGWEEHCRFGSGLLWIGSASKIRLYAFHPAFHPAEEPNSQITRCDLCSPRSQAIQRGLLNARSQEVPIRHQAPYTDFRLLRGSQPSGSSGYLDCFSWFCGSFQQTTNSARLLAGDLRTARPSGWIRSVLSCFCRGGCLKVNQL